MARKGCRAPATTEQVLTCLRTHCGGCGQPISVAYRTQRTITTLQGSCRLTDAVFAGVAIQRASGIIGLTGQRRRGNGHYRTESSASM